MNLYKVMNDKEIKLLENAGIKVENKDYVQEDFKRMEQQVIDFIMSASSKNGDIDRLRNQYDCIFRMINVE